MDKLIYDTSLREQNPESSPFLERNMATVDDGAAAGNYQSQQCTFETVSLSNNGRYCNYREGYLTVPLVMVVSGTTPTGQGGAAVAIDWTGNHVKHSDLMLAMKNSNLNIIDSITIDFGGKQCVQETSNINQYLIYKQHESLSAQDEFLNGPVTGYYKDDSTSWYFDDVNGLCNNMNDQQEPMTQRLPKQMS